MKTLYKQEVVNIIKEIISTFNINISLEQSKILCFINGKNSSNYIMPHFKIKFTEGLEDRLKDVNNSEKMKELMSKLSSFIIEYCIEKNINGEILFILSQEEEQEEEIDPLKILSKYPSLKFLIDRIDDKPFVKEVIEAYLQRDEQEDLRKLHGSL